MKKIKKYIAKKLYNFVMTHYGNSQTPIIQHIKLNPVTCRSTICIPKQMYDFMNEKESKDYIEKELSSKLIDVIKEYMIVNETVGYREDLRYFDGVIDVVERMSK